MAGMKDEVVGCEARDLKIDALQQDAARLCADIRRNRLGFTLAEAAVMFSCDVRTVKRWAAGEVRIPGSAALALRLLAFIDQNEMMLPITSSWRDVVPGLPYDSDRRTGRSVVGS